MKGPSEREIQRDCFDYLALVRGWFCWRQNIVEEVLRWTTANS